MSDLLHQPRPRVRFWPHTDDARVASTRIRCHQVLAGLQQQGVDAALYRPGADGAAEGPPAALVLAKRYDAASLQHALALRQQHGTRLLLDICDNHFHADPPSPAWQQRAEALRAACRAVDLVVCASDTLAEVVVRESGEQTAVAVVPDALDRAIGQTREPQSLSDRLHALRWQAFSRLHRVAAGRRLLWFGNHGAGYAEGGMADLGLITPALAAHHRQQPLSLTVVSNRHRTYRRVSRGWAWPSLYLPWSDANITLALRQHAVVLIPARHNPFTLCKTNNRLATAFGNGLAVAADGLPSYLEFADLAVLDDWHTGLASLMASADDRNRRVSLARQRLEQRYSLDVISRRWVGVLQRVGVLPAPQAAPTAS